jgi:hypothetical protein
LLVQAPHTQQKKDFLFRATNSKLFYLIKSEKEAKQKEHTKLSTESLVVTEKAKEKTDRIAKWKAAWEKTKEIPMTPRTNV